METTTSLNKNIVSLHVEQCELGCPHAEVCYLKKRESNSGSPLPTNFRAEMLEQGFTLHESVCNKITDMHINLLLNYPNYNITVSYPVLLKLPTSLFSRKFQVQVSVYTEEQVIAAKSWNQKLFLIKDEASLALAIKLSKNKDISNLHFNVDQNFKDTWQTIMLVDVDRNISLDSCMYSWIVNGECPYTYNYVDISHDWTIRHCPFSIKGTPIPENIITDKKNYKDLFMLPHTPDLCCYAERFKNRGE